jgi:hypothetical protein
MIWGLNYSGMNLVAVSIVILEPTGINSAQDGSWSSTSTWTSGDIPGLGDEVTIQSGHHVTLDGNIQVDDLTVEYNAALLMPTGTSLTIEGTLSNNGLMQQTLDVPFGSTTEFLHITNGSGIVNKYLGIDITPNSTAMGSTTVSIQGNHTGGCTTVMNDPLMYRCYEITPGSEESATLRFWYDEDERNGQEANNLVLWHYNGGNDWSKVGTFTYSEDGEECVNGGGRECWLEVSGISEYSVFDIGRDGNEPTAVTLIEIKAGNKFKDSSLLIFGLVSILFLYGVLFIKKR